MNSVVADDANNVESLLDTRVKPIRNQRRDVDVDVLSRLTEFFAKLLDGQANQRGGSSGRFVENGARLVVVSPYVVREVGVRGRSLTALRINETVVDPDGYIVAIEALGDRYVVQF